MAKRRQGGGPEEEPYSSVVVIRKIRELLATQRYTIHAQERLIERKIQPLEVVAALNGRIEHDPEMNEFDRKHNCWSYAVFGRGLDSHLKIVVGFKEPNLLIITVVRIRPRR